MNSNEQQIELKSEIESLEGRVRKLREKVESLTNAATEDMIARVEELETMSNACRRDIEEIDSDRGPDRETVGQLYATTEAMTASLEDEVEALSLGNPTTVSAAVDAVMNLGDSGK